jgi:hypothetical protein
MLRFLTLPIPICWPKSQPGDKLPTQPEPYDEVSDEKQREVTEKPRKKPKKATNKKFSGMISAFIDWVMTWSMGTILIPLQVLPICYSLCLVSRISASSVSQNPSFLSDLAPMLIIVLNSIFIFLYAGQEQSLPLQVCTEFSLMSFYLLKFFCVAERYKPDKTIKNDPQQQRDCPTRSCWPGSSSRRTSSTSRPHANPPSDGPPHQGHTSNQARSD